MRAVILCAGQGRRLLPETSEIPKGLLPVRGDRPILALQLEALDHHPQVHIEREQAGNVLQSLKIEGSQAVRVLVTKQKQTMAGLSIMGGHSNPRPPASAVHPAVPRPRR